MTLSILLALLMARVVTPGPARVTEIECPAPPGSGEPNLVTGADGKLYLTWIERDGKLARLRFSRFRGGSWTEVRTISSGTDWFVNWADFPSLAVLADGTMAAHWLEKSGPGTYSYDVRIALSGDSGKTWTPAVKPHRDHVEAEHGFVSLVPLDADRFAVFWLDGRAMVDDRGLTTSRPMALRYTTLAKDGALGAEVLVDDRVCECCQTGAVRLPDGSAFVVYRDRSSGEVRDISGALVTRTGEVATRSLPADAWKIEGCPVNGPAIAASGRSVVVAWYSEGAEEDPRVVVSWSSKVGFSKPVRVDDGQPIGRVDVVLETPETALVSWIEVGKEAAEVRARRVRRDGTRDRSRVVAPTVVSRASGFPRLAIVERTVVLAWTDVTDRGRVRTACLRLDSAPRQ